MKQLFLLCLSLCIAVVVSCQDEAADKTGLLLMDCSYSSHAEAMVLRDKGELSVAGDYNLRLDRQLTIKFFKERKLDKDISDIVFYPSSVMTRYAKLTVTIVDLDPNTKGLLPKDVTGKVTTTHLEQSGLKIKRGSLLKVSYSVTFPYDEKVADWRFQSIYPTDYSDLRVTIPESVTMRTSLEGSYHPDVTNTTQAVRQVHLGSQTNAVKVTENYYQFNQVPAYRIETFCDNPANEFVHLKCQMVSIYSEASLKKDFAIRQADKIVEALSVKPDFMLRLNGELDIKADYDRLIRTVTNPEEKIARIYELVRRRMTWDHIDTFSARPLQKVWADKKGNSSELNLMLVKLLDVYGFDAAPLLVSRRAAGSIDSNEFALSDFNRAVAHVRMGERSIVLDATARYYDYPMTYSGILNTTGLLISMDKHRWINVADDKTYYHNNVVLLGHLLGDTSFLTNVYVNSSGYAKAEHVEMYERDSLKGIRNYFEHGDKSIHLKHFIVANEYVDTLPFAQEFDIRAPLIKNENLCGVIPTYFSIPDTLFTLGDDRRSSVNFGYKQQYDLVSEFSFPERYELYVMPNYISLSAVNGAVHYEREFHNSTTSFSMRQSFIIDKSYFNTSEAIELAKFLRKVDNLMKQQVILKKLY